MGPKPVGEEQREVGVETGEVVVVGEGTLVEARAGRRGVEAWEWKDGAGLVGIRQVCWVPRQVSVGRTPGQAPMEDRGSR